MGDHFEFGLEVDLVDGIPVKWSSTSLPPDPCWLSPAFVNAHSHLEYRGLQGKLDGLEYWPWIRELTRLKGLQTPEDVALDCQLAAWENRATGVAAIGEHSDRPYSASALASVGIQGWIFQELITFFEAADPLAKWAQVESRCDAQARFPGLEAVVNPHATWSVDKTSLSRFGEGPVSIHAAETPYEAELFERGEGPIAEMFRKFGLKLPVRQPLFDMLEEVDLMRKGVQMVHLGATTRADIDRLAEAEVVVAHCPRSNVALGCPLPDVRGMLDAGIGVGLGMDSAASSGPIDMFAEMRAMKAGSDVTVEEVWRCATNGGAATLGYRHWGETPQYESSIGLPEREEFIRWIKIESAAGTPAALLAKGSPCQVTWLT